jgi:hypothetical protein
MGAPPTRRRPSCHKPRGGSALNSSCAMYTDTPSPAAPCDGECVGFRRIFAENERCTTPPVLTSGFGKPLSLSLSLTWRIEMMPDALPCWGRWLRVFVRVVPSATAKVGQLDEVWLDITHGSQTHITELMPRSASYSCPRHTRPPPVGPRKSNSS